MTALHTRELPADGSWLVNPERGFFRWIEVLDPEVDFGALRRDGLTLGFARVSLADFRGRALDDALLGGLAAGLERVRAAGLKVVLRFVYNEDERGADARLWRIRRHIRQLRPVLQADADVIAVLQAGFIGAWGEWHSSARDLAQPRPARRVALSLLRALPSSRCIQVRTPRYKRWVVKEALTEATAFGRSRAARIGLHNDCLLAGDDDHGTYVPPVAADKAWAANEGRFTPVGGETCALGPRATGERAVAELQKVHTDFLNADYHPDVIEDWRRTGHWDAIGRRLGYRLAAREVAWGPIEGGVRVRLVLANEGFSAPINPREVWLVLDGPVRIEHRLRADPRRWEPGAHILEADVPVPIRCPRAPYRLSLWLPDPMASLRHRPEYALHLASAEHAGPLNVLATNVRAG